MKLAGLHPPDRAAILTAPLHLHLWHEAEGTDPMRLEERVAIVTGAARGIGQAYCLALAREGAKIVAVDILSCAATVAKVQEAGGEVLGVTADIANAEGTQAMADQTVQRFGRIDILVNNAAVLVKSS